MLHPPPTGECIMLTSSRVLGSLDDDVELYFEHPYQDRRIDKSAAIVCNEETRKLLVSQKKPKGMGLLAIWFEYGFKASQQGTALLTVCCVCFVLPEMSRKVIL